MKPRLLTTLVAALGLCTGHAFAQEITLKVHHFLPPGSNAHANLIVHRDLKPSSILWPSESLRTGVSNRSRFSNASVRKSMRFFVSRSSSS